MWRGLGAVVFIGDSAASRRTRVRMEGRVYEHAVVTLEPVRKAIAEVSASNQGNEGPQTPASCGEAGGKA